MSHHRWHGGLRHPAHQHHRPIRAPRFAAARLPESDRKDLAIQALARSETVSDLAARHGVSRKFVYQQTHKAVAALDDAFLSATPDDGVLFELAVIKAWLRQVIVALTLICHSSYRGVVEFLRDLLGLSISVGSVHDVLEAATQQASAINYDQDLSSIRVGLHDEIFHGATPVLAGVDAHSTYCYILAAERRRDADTWGVHLLDAAQQGLDPDYTIADAGQGLRAGQKAAWGDTPCHGNVFHIQRQCEGLANTLARLAKGATSRRKTLQAKMGRAGPRGPDDELATQLALARQSEARANWLARHFRTLVHRLLSCSDASIPTWCSIAVSPDGRTRTTRARASRHHSGRKPTRKAAPGRPITASTGPRSAAN